MVISLDSGLRLTFRQAQFLFIKVASISQCQRQPWIEWIQCGAPLYDSYVGLVA